MYLLAIFLPPVAVLMRKGILAAILNLFLCLFGFFPGVIHALIVVSETNADKRTAKLEKKFDELISTQSGGAKPNLDTPEPKAHQKKDSVLKKMLTLKNIAWFFVFIFVSTAITNLSEFKLLHSILYLATALMIAPATWKVLNKKYDNKTNNILKVITAVLIFISLANGIDEDKVEIEQIQTEPVVAEVQPEVSQPTEPLEVSENREEVKEKNDDLSSVELNEDNRKEIFLAMLAMEDEVTADAEEFYPTDITHPDYADDNIYKKLDYIDTFTEIGKEKVLEEHKIDISQWKEILAEGIKKEWDLE